MTAWHGLSSPCSSSPFFLHGLESPCHVSAVEKSLLSHQVHVRQGAYLPHWTRSGSTYALVFRLADSLPATLVAAWRRERALLLAAQTTAGTLTSSQEERLRELFSDKIERHLDAGHGACWLRRPEIAVIVADALRHFDGERYELAAWSVMPNHVHVVTQPLGAHSLSAIVQSWKGFSARAANRLLNRSGEFWQPEPYDHLIRDASEFAHAIRYTLENPAKAGLRDWPWVWASDAARKLAGL